MGNKISSPEQIKIKNITGKCDSLTINVMESLRYCKYLKYTFVLNIDSDLSRFDISIYNNLCDEDKWDYYLFFRPIAVNQICKRYGSLLGVKLISIQTPKDPDGDTLEHYNFNKVKFLIENFKKQTIIFQNPLYID
jgi:hypothetical protein